MNRSLEHVPTPQRRQSWAVVLLLCKIAGTIAAVTTAAVAVAQFALGH